MVLRRTYCVHDDAFANLTVAEDNPVRLSRLRKFPQISGLAIHESKSCAFYRALSFVANQFGGHLRRVGLPDRHAPRGSSPRPELALVFSGRKILVCRLFRRFGPSCNRFSTWLPRAPTLLGASASGGDDCSQGLRAPGESMSNLARERHRFRAGHVCRSRLLRQRERGLSFPEASKNGRPTRRQRSGGA